jgi:hypothetical protein
MSILQASLRPFNINVNVRMAVQSTQQWLFTKSPHLHQTKSVTQKHLTNAPPLIGRLSRNVMLTQTMG